MTTIIAFSKNRPFQLKEYLRTATTYLQGEYEIAVIWTADEQFKPQYEKLIAMFPQVRFVAETSFEHQLREAIDGAGACIMWGVDDALFYRPFNLDTAAQYLQEHPQVLGWHVKMSPGLILCRSFGSVPQIVPPLTAIKDGFVFDRHGGTYDWNYPWEVIGTAYRRDVVQRLLHVASLAGRTASTPNDLEGAVAPLFGENSPLVRGMGSSMACCREPVMSVISVNCVQRGRSYLFDTQRSPEEMLTFFDENREYDDEFYRQQQFLSVHIGDFRLK